MLLTKKNANLFSISRRANHLFTSWLHATAAVTGWVVTDRMRSLQLKRVSSSRVSCFKISTSCLADFSSGNFGVNYFLERVKTWIFLESNWWFYNLFSSPDVCEVTHTRPRLMRSKNILRYQSTTTFHWSVLIHLVFLSEGADVLIKYLFCWASVVRVHLHPIRGGFTQGGTRPNQLHELHLQHETCPHSTNVRRSLQLEFRLMIHSLSHVHLPTQQFVDASNDLVWIVTSW